MTLQVAGIAASPSAAGLRVANVSATGVATSATLQVAGIHGPSGSTLRVTAVSAGQKTATLRVAGVSVTPSRTLRVAYVSAVPVVAPPVGTVAPIVRPLPPLTVDAFDVVQITPTAVGGTPDSYLFTVLQGDVQLTGGVPLGNVPPVASFLVSVNGPKITLDGSTSTDPGGHVVAWGWDFGDGSNATGVTTTHIYAASGVYQVQLTVTDNQGATSTQTSAVTVAVPSANKPPIAAFTTSVSAATVAVDGTGSSDPDGTIVSYLWAWGDGTTTTGATSSHTYTTTGTRTVVLTVTDNAGATTSTSKTVTATVPNTPPVASFTATITNLALSVDASASSDPDGTIASYGWTFGDGQTATGKTATHTYAAAGSFTVTLTVTDNVGAAVSTIQTVNATAVAAVQPTGTGIVRYQDVTGTTLSDRWKAAGTSMLSLQVGTTYPVSDFAYAFHGRYSALNDEDGGSLGLLGAGPASTVIQMGVNTSTKTAAATYSNEYTLLHVDNRTNVKLDGFRLNGSAQTASPLFGAISLDSCTNPTCSNLLVTNFYGNSPSPPGETFGLSHHSGTGGLFDTLEFDGSGGTVTDSTKWVASSMLATNTTTGAFTIRRLFGHESRYGKSFAGWQSLNGGQFTECWTVNTAFGIGFEEMTGTYTLDNCVFGGNVYDFHLGHSAQYNGGARATLIFRNPVYLGTKTKLVGYLPSSYTGAGSKGNNQQVVGDIQILRGSDAAGWTDVTAAELNATPNWLQNSDGSYKGTPLTGYTKPAWAFTA